MGQGGCHNGISEEAGCGGEGVELLARVEGAEGGAGLDGGGEEEGVGDEAERVEVGEGGEDVGEVVGAGEGVDEGGEGEEGGVGEVGGEGEGELGGGEGESVGVEGEEAGGELGVGEEVQSENEGVGLPRLGQGGCAGGQALGEGVEHTTLTVNVAARFSERRKCCCCCCMSLCLIPYILQIEYSL